MKKYKVLPLILLLSFILISCGSSKNVSYEPPGSSYTDYESTPRETEPVETTTEEKSSTDLNIPSDRKVIVSYYLEIETKEYDASINSLNELINSYNGVRTFIEENNYSTRNISMSVSIPSDKASQFVDEIGKIESLVILNKNLSSEDVTDKYTDTELRLKILREKLERLNNLQANQTELESLLALENEISETILEIERIEGSLRAMDSKIDYTTVEFRIREISSVVSTQTRPAFGSRLSTAFVESIDNFISGIQEFIIGLIYVIPQLILLAIIIAVLIFILRPIYNKFIKNRVPKKTNAPKGRRFYNNNVKEDLINENEPKNDDTKIE